MKTLVSICVFLLFANTMQILQKHNSFPFLLSLCLEGFFYSYREKNLKNSSENRFSSEKAFGISERFMNWVKSHLLEKAQLPFHEFWINYLMRRYFFTDFCFSLRSFFLVKYSIMANRDTISYMYDFVWLKPIHKHFSCWKSSKRTYNVKNWWFKMSTGTSVLRTFICVTGKTTFTLHNLWVLHKLFVAF